MSLQVMTFEHARALTAEVSNNLVCVRTWTAEIRDYFVRMRRVIADVTGKSWTSVTHSEESSLFSLHCISIPPILYI